jgi:hypothetical protein
MYIYLSGMFFPPFYAVFFIAQWLVILAAKKWSGRFWKPEPEKAFLTSQFWNIFATALAATILLLPMVYVLLTGYDPGANRVSQAFFLNPQINQGDPWGLLWRSIVGNFSGYGVSLTWLIGQAPANLYLPVSIGLMVFIGFLISIWRGLRGQASYLFILLWLPVLLLPSILSPDTIPHHLRTIGATTPVYVFAAITVVWFFELLFAASKRWLQPRLGNSTKWVTLGLGVAVAILLILPVAREFAYRFNLYFYIFPHTDDAKAAYHVYAVDMAKEINREDDDRVAFVLPRNTAAGDIFPNFTTDFLTELEQPLAEHYWVIDNEETLVDDLTKAAAEHSVIRVVRWKTSKHTGADPKGVIPYYLEKYGDYDDTFPHGYFEVDKYELEKPAPDFSAAETLTPISANFGDQLELTGYALGDAGNVDHITDPQAVSNDLLWLRLAWRKTAEQPEDSKVSALIYADDGHRVTQADKLLQSNILQAGSREWAVGAEEDTYFLIPIPPATPPGEYTLKLAVYGVNSLNRLPVADGPDDDQLTLADFTVVPATKPVTEDDLTMALLTNHELVPGLTLVGLETLPGESVRSGNRVGASLIWQAGDTPIAEDLAMQFVVRPPEGDDVWPISEPVGLAGSYPSSQWQPGKLLRGWLFARIPPAWDPGTYKLDLRLSLLNDPNTEVVTLPIGEFQVEGWTRNFDAPQPQIEIKADFNGQATLAGLDATAQQVSPGETLGVRLYWQPTAEFTQDYTAFVHLIGPDGMLHGQVDQTPGAGAYPTTGWLPGETIADEYSIAIPGDAPAGDYQIEIGMYNPITGQRLPVCLSSACDQVDDKVLLPGLTVQ